MSFTTVLFICASILYTISAINMYLYKRMLVMKAKDGTAEYINGRFYYIKEEGEQWTSVEETLQPKKR
jgi:hypothetical protein